MTFLCFKKREIFNVTEHTYNKETYIYKSFTRKFFLFGKKGIEKFSVIKRNWLSLCD